MVDSRGAGARRGVGGMIGDLDRSAERWAMVEETIAGRDVRDAAVLDAMRAVPRERFLPAEARPDAYGDYPVPIGWGQTASQPYIVAYMAEALELRGDERVLEIGTGSGYEAAVLALLAAEVWSVERYASLAKRAARALSRLGMLAEDGFIGLHGPESAAAEGRAPAGDDELDGAAGRVRVIVADGFLGLPGRAPFDAIIASAAPSGVPRALIDQLSPDGGRLVAPVTDGYGQVIVRVRRSGARVTRETLIPVAFVPMLPGVVE